MHLQWILLSSYRTRQNESIENGRTWQNSNDADAGAGECWWCHNNWKMRKSSCSCWNYSRVASTCSGVMPLSTSNRLCCSLKYSKAWDVMVAQPNLVRQSQIWRWFESERCWPWDLDSKEKKLLRWLQKVVHFNPRPSQTVLAQNQLK